MNDDLDKITYGEYKKRNGLGSKSSKSSLSNNIESGLSKDNLLSIIKVADMSKIKMFVWVDCLKNYVRVYRNSMVDSIHKCPTPEKLTVRKEYRELYFK
jgi:hypothetical protein